MNFFAQRVRVWPRVHSGFSCLKFFFAAAIAKLKAKFDSQLSAPLQQCCRLSPLLDLNFLFATTQRQHSIASSSTKS